MQLFDYERATRLMGERGIDLILASSKLGLRTRLPSLAIAAAASASGQIGAAAGLSPSNHSRLVWMRGSGAPPHPWPPR